MFYFCRKKIYWRANKLLRKLWYEAGKKLLSLEPYGQDEGDIAERRPEIPGLEARYTSHFLDYLREANEQ